jgi:hypothetical protein
VCFRFGKYAPHLKIVAPFALVRRATFSPQCGEKEGIPYCPGA